MSDLILITGASGELGSYLYKTMTEAGHHCVKAGRKSERHFSLDKPVSRELLKDVKVVIHCAYDFSPTNYEDSFKVNVLGTFNLCDAVEESAVEHFILVSSDSAHESADSIYGRVKFQTELFALKYSKPTIIRVGLVGGIRPMGPFATLVKLADKFKVGVVLFPDKPAFSYFKSEDFLPLFTRLVSSGPLGGPFSASRESSPLTMRMAIARASARKIVLVHVPASFCYAIMRAKELIFGIGGLRSDSIKSIMQASRTTHIGNIWDKF